MAYEKPEADVLLRKRRNAKKDRFVDWQLMLHACGFTGVIQTVLSFTMSYWFAQRNGLPFSRLWFGFGDVPSGVSQGKYTKVLDEASSTTLSTLL